ncbi:hypothetical protein [Mycolicibacterium frederiksbergense]|uniref:hypothetical protein n=1 Tax=Mycolicibacterium frederiksbergense TaxID=117567 RepID=UPI003999857C
MQGRFIGWDAVAAGTLTGHALRTRYRAVYPSIYLRRDIELTAALRAEAAWLWSKKRAVVAGNAAAALHGAKWVDARCAAELIHHNRRPPVGIHVWSDDIEDDEIVDIGGMRVCTPARAAFDLARRYPLDRAVAAIDALVNATRLDIAAVEKLMSGHPARRGTPTARKALPLVDGGAESPRETWLRLLVMRAGYPRPHTQIRVRDRHRHEFARIDLGWEDRKIGLEYEGKHHQTDRFTYERDIRRLDELSGLGWIILRVTAADTEDSALIRLADAWRRRM